MASGNWSPVSRCPKEHETSRYFLQGTSCLLLTIRRQASRFYTGGGTYMLNGSSYTEHMDFASDVIATGLVGKEQQFTVKLDGDTFTQTGTLTNGKPLSEVWKRVN